MVNTHINSTQRHKNEERWNEENGENIRFDLRF
jgi:post-segregation antitoxin (ccd killing protein)